MKLSLAAAGLSLSLAVPALAGSTYKPSYSPPPARSYSPPPARSYSPPPARSYSPPARTYSPPAKTYSPPARQQEYKRQDRQNDNRRQDTYRAQQNQVVKDSIKKQQESSKRFK